MGKRITPPLCIHCGNVSKLVTGDLIYGHRPDLYEKKFYLCELCDAWVGCHKGTNRALGYPANAALRNARSLLHEGRIDPLWKNSVSTGDYEPEDPKAIKIIRNVARRRVYAFLAQKLGIDVKVCHTGMFDLATCRRAWVALTRVTYPEIRTWAKERKIEDERADPPNADPGRTAEGDRDDRGRV